MKLENNTFCPLLKENCVGLKCAWFMQVQGQNPQTGEQLNEWGCAMSWMPLLLIENSKQQHQTGAAIESFRNEMVDANKTNIALLASRISSQPKLNRIEG